MRHVTTLPIRWVLAVVLCQPLISQAISPLDDDELNGHFYSSGISSDGWAKTSSVMSIQDFNASLAQPTDHRDTEASKTLLAMDIHHSQNVDYSEATFSAQGSGDRDGAAASADHPIVAAAHMPPSEVLKKVSALIAASMPPPDSTLTQNMLAWQMKQDLAPNGKQAQAQALLGDIMNSQIGSERYSLRWAGNLPDVLIVQRDPYLDGRKVVDMLGNDVELHMSSNTATILEIKGYRSH